MISRWNDKAAAASRMALDAVFIVAALLKWLNPAGQSTYYGNLAHAAPVVGWAIIAGELLLGGWLLSGFRTGWRQASPFLCWRYFPVPSWPTCWQSTQFPAAALVRRGRLPTARQPSSTVLPPA